MPRAARQFSKTGFYHIMMRGINRERIFEKEAAKKEILHILAVKVRETDVGIYAYCVMDNHIHLVLKSEPQELAVFMKKLNGSFAMYYNREQRRVGHVFQDRYKSERIEDEEYFWGVIRYIHLNPAKAHLVKNAEDYQWSSMKDFLLGKSDVLAKEALALKQDNFKDNRSFLDMHKQEDLHIYLEVKEELDEMKKAAGSQLIENILVEHGITTVMELREQEEALENLLGRLARELKLSYQEIAKMTGLSYSMVQRLVQR